MPDHDFLIEMLRAAKSDAKAICNMLDIEAFDDRIFGFHAQQAVEKALKAWLYFLQGSHPFTHDLSLLLNNIEQTGQDVTIYWDFLELNEFAVQYRYELQRTDEEPLNRPSLVSDICDLIEKVEGIVSHS